ncbi:MAG: terminase family protein [Bryobacteraceae bacterium]
MASAPKPIVPLLAWQQQWIEDEHRFKLVVAAAQAAGKSFVTSLEASIDRMKPGAASANLGILLSASDRQSVELMEKVKMHTRAWDVKFEDGYFAQTSIVEHRAIFPNGKRLIALPANPDTARGYSGDMLFDEFALHRDSKAIWAAGMTRISRGFKCRVASTVKGLANQFGELLKMLGLADGIAPEKQPVERQGWHGYWVDAAMAVAQGSPVDLKAMRDAIGDEDIWLQDFCNVPMEDGSQYISLSLILECESSEATLEWDGQPRPGLSAGYDVARKRDGSVIVLGYPIGPLAVICGVIVISQQTFERQREICAEVAEVVEASGGRFALDATGIGMQLGEELSQGFTDSKGRRRRFDCVEPVNFATAVESGLKDEEGKPLKVMVKERLAGLVKRRCEERSILLPESVQLRREFQAVKRYVGATGAVRLDAERTGKGGHADWFWAAALLCGAMEGPRRQYIPASEGGTIGRTVAGNLMGVEF